MGVNGFHEKLVVNRCYISFLYCGECADTDKNIFNDTKQNGPVTATY